MAIPFAMYNLGNSGGSWMESVIRSHPECMCWEELRRTLKLPKPTTKEEDDENQKLILSFFQMACDGENLKACGLIKGFRAEVECFIRERGGRFAQQCRHPIRHIHGTRKRAKQSVNGLGRQPKDPREYFLGRVLWQAKRYELYLTRSQDMPFLRLEDLNASLREDGLYIQQALTWLTQVEWTDGDIQRIRDTCPPRHRRSYPPNLWFDENYECESEKAHSWERRADPPASAIWAHWEPWQRETFLKHFEVIMLSLGYAIPEVN